MSLLHYSRKNKQVIFTITEAEYAIMALTMFDSVSQFYQDSDLVLFVIGMGTLRKLDGNISIVYIDDIVDELDLDQRLAYYLTVELATSFRPQCFEFLFAQNYERAIYLDPDTYVFRRMTEVDDLLQNSANGIVTPHSLHTLATNNPALHGDADAILLQCGIFNLGFLALKNTDETLRMLKWWREKLKWKCLANMADGYFVDQKWLEFLPVYFDGFHILKLPTYNLAPWNAGQYKILPDSSASNFFINDFDHPVAFIHFSGMKRADKHFIHMLEPYNFYLNQMLKRKFIKLGFVNYEIRLKQKNFYLDKVCIPLYKDYVNETENTSSNPLVDPEFYNFLHSMDYETQLPVYIKKLYEIMPEIFIGYLYKTSTISYDSFIPLIKEEFSFDGTVSLETMIQLRNDSIKVDYKIKYADELLKTEHHHKAKSKFSHHLALLSFGDDLKNHGGQKSSASDQEIIVKSDRTEIINGNIRVCIPHMDERGNLQNLTDIKAEDYTELWVPSTYCEKKLRSAHGLSKLATIPYPVLKPKYKIQEIEIPNNKFIVMMRHDFNQDFTSQNPLASLKAFQKAFEHKTNVLLLCFLGNVKHSEDYKALIAAFREEKNAKIIEGTLDDDLYYSYLHYTDCLISLHEETIFGYALAEAMSLGKYVIATTNGGNTDYMNAENSFLIGNLLLNSSAAEAAKTLASIYENTNIRDDKSKKAKLSIQKHLSPNTVGFIMQKRLEILNNSKSPVSVPVWLKQLRRLKAFLKPRLKKIPLCVRIYIKLKSIRDRYLFPRAGHNNSYVTVTKILLKRIKRPVVLE